MKVIPFLAIGFATVSVLFGSFVGLGGVNDSVFPFLYFMKVGYHSEILVFKANNLCSFRSPTLLYPPLYLNLYREIRISACLVLFFPTNTTYTFGLIVQQPGAPQHASHLNANFPSILLTHGNSKPNNSPNFLPTLSRHTRQSPATLGSFI